MPQDPITAKVLLRCACGRTWCSRGPRKGKWCWPARWWKPRPGVIVAGATCNWCRKTRKLRES